jgi:hypothetical protein
MKRLLVVLALTLITRAYGHHSFAATYADGRQTIEGVVVQFLLRNPHSFVQVEVKDAKGEALIWAVEWAAAGQLAGQGIKRDTLKAGDRIVVVGNPARNAEDHRLRMISVTRPSDGLKWGGTFD